MKLFTTFSIFLFFTIFVQAQEQEENFDLFVFGVPQYLVTNGIRIDLDIHDKGTQKWWVLSPYFYSDKSSIDLLNLSSDDYYDAYSFDDLIGGGLGINRKIYLSKNYSDRGIYLGVGGEYKFFQIKGESFTYVEYTGEDGFLYQHMEDIDYRMNINTGSLRTYVGLQSELIPFLFTDIFMGVGLRFSHHNSPQNVTIKYNRGYFDYGYTGTMFVFGIRFGIGY